MRSTISQKHNYSRKIALILSNRPEARRIRKFNNPGANNLEETINVEEDCHGSIACSYLFACGIVRAGHSSHRPAGPYR
jgi:hypothetical protein